MNVLYLVLAIVLEICGTFFTKESQGLTNRLASILMLLCYGSSFICLALATKKIPISIAYSAWTGIAIVAISVIGTVWFKEPMNLIKAISIGLTVAGIVGLNMSGNG
jgi:small multidrug resistance pump